ncbi:hypothetical protein NHG33_04000 [Aerococcaceae bacterium NML130460]|nr:hypothetical protein [Aerococcaceae bacterium NML130460]
MGLYSAYAEYRNIWVVVNKHHLSYMGRIASYKPEATSQELERLATFMTCLKQLPKEQVQVVLVRYFKLANYEASKDKALLRYPKQRVYDKYKGRCATLKEVAGELGISWKRVRELEYLAYDNLAPLLLGEKLKGYELYSSEAKEYFRGSKAYVMDRVAAFKKKVNVIEETLYPVVEQLDYWRASVTYRKEPQWREKR